MLGVDDVNAVREGIKVIRGTESSYYSQGRSQLAARRILVCNDRQPSLGLLKGASRVP